MNTNLPKYLNKFDAETLSFIENRVKNDSIISTWGSVQHNRNKASRYFFRLHINQNAPAVSATEKAWRSFMFETYPELQEHENTLQVAYEEKRQQRLERDKQAENERFRVLQANFKQYQELTNNEDICFLLSRCDVYNGAHMRTKGALNKLHSIKFYENGQIGYSKKTNWTKKGYAKPTLSRSEYEVLKALQDMMLNYDVDFVQGFLSGEDIGNAEQANNGSVGNAEQANNGSVGNAEQANNGSVGNAEQANNGSVGNAEQANNGSVGNAEQANNGSVGDAEQANVENNGLKIPARQKQTLEDIFEELEEFDNNGSVKVNNAFITCLKNNKDEPILLFLVNNYVYSGSRNSYTASFLEYDNKDNSLQFISRNARIATLLSGESSYTCTQEFLIGNAQMAKEIYLALEKLNSLYSGNLVLKFESDIHNISKFVPFEFNYISDLGNAEQANVENCTLGNAEQANVENCTLGNAEQVNHYNICDNQYVLPGIILPEGYSNRKPKSYTFDNLDFEAQEYANMQLQQVCKCWIEWKLDKTDTPELRHFWEDICEDKDFYYVEPDKKIFTFDIEGNIRTYKNKELPSFLEDDMEFIKVLFDEFEFTPSYVQCGLHVVTYNYVNNKVHFQEWIDLTEMWGGVQ